MPRESQVLPLCWHHSFTALSGTNERISLGGWFPSLVDWHQVLPDLLVHRRPFSSPTHCHPRRLSHPVLAGNWLVVKLRSCCFFSDYSSNFLFPPSLAAWPQRCLPHSFLTSWALAAWSPTKLIAFSPGSAGLWTGCQGPFVPSTKYSGTWSLPRSITRGRLPLSRPCCGYCFCSSRVPGPGHSFLPCSPASRPLPYAMVLITRSMSYPPSIPCPAQLL